MMKLIWESKLPISVIMHILICLSNFVSEDFAEILEELGLVQQIEEFSGHYQGLKVSQELTTVDKKTVLDLC